MSSDITCSITLSTRNKCDALAVTLASIRRQNIPFQYEIIVTDDGSTDETTATCNKFGVRYYCTHNTRYRNPSVARNIAFRAARGSIIIAQSDDIVHVAPDAVESLVNDLVPGTFALGCTDNYRYENGKPVEFIQTYCGPMRPVHYFFFGALYRSDLYAVGGYDEEFTEPCYDDDWFAECLVQGLSLRPVFTDHVLAHHQFHGYPPNSHVREAMSKQLYRDKLTKARQTGQWNNSGGCWTFNAIKSTNRITTPRISKTLVDDTGKIPKRMHFFWAGQRLSWMRLMTLLSFRYYHRDWDVVLHHLDSAQTEKTWQSLEAQDGPNIGSRQYLDDLKLLDIELQPWEAPTSLTEPIPPAHASDLFQWRLLAEEGGFYADMDILFVAPLPYERIKNVDAVFCLTHEYMAIGFFAATPNNALFRDVLQTARQNYSHAGYQSTGAEAVYRLAETIEGWGSTPQVGTKTVDALARKYPGTKIITLPNETIYPWHFREVACIFHDVLEVPKACCGIHWFGGDSLAQGWNEKLTHENYRDYDNTFTRYAVKVLDTL